MLIQRPADYLGSAESFLLRCMAFRLKEGLDAEDPTPSSRDMTSVDVSYNNVLSQLNTIRYFCEKLHGELAHRAEESISESISGAESESGVESFD